MDGNEISREGKTMTDEERIKEALDQIEELNARIKAKDDENIRVKSEANGLRTVLFMREKELEKEKDRADKAVAMLREQRQAIDSLHVKIKKQKLKLTKTQKKLCEMILEREEPRQKEEP